MRVAPTEEERAAASYECSPIREFQGMKGDPINSWGFVGDLDFSYRAAAVFGTGFLGGSLFVAQVFPPVFPEDPEIVIENVAAIGLYGSFIAFSLVLVSMYLLLTKWDGVGRRLRNSLFVVEFDPTPGLNFDSGGAGAYSYKQQKAQDEIERDRLLADLEVEPSLRRTRSYALGALACAIVGVAGGSLVDAEMAIVDEPPETQQSQEEDPEMAGFYNPNKKVAKPACKNGCIPGLADN